MRFFLSGSLLATAAIIAAVDNLFDDSFPDASGFLNIPQDGLQDVSQDVSQNLSQDPLLDWYSEDLDITQNGNLFSDFDSTDLLSTTTDLDSYDLLASCSVDEQQSSDTLRVRDDDENSCANPVPFQDGLRETLDNLQRLWNGETLMDLMKPTPPEPDPEEPPPPGIIPTAPPDDVRRCSAEYPIPLCCSHRGSLMEERGGIEIYHYVSGCERGMLSSILVDIVKPFIGF